MSNEIGKGISAEGCGAVEVSDDLVETPMELDLLNKQVLRLRAEMENYRKRVERTTNDLVQRSKASLLRDFLIVVDDLDRALLAFNDSSNVGAVRTGVELTYERLCTLLEAQGVRTVDATGEFDPRVHSAVATRRTGDVLPGTITDELQRGYCWGDDVLRAACVEVAVAEGQ